MSLDTDVTAAELQVIGLFGALDEALLITLARELPVMTKHAGEIVFREGDAGRAMYVVLNGQLELTKRTKRGREARIALLDNGEWFGEMCLLDVSARSFTARAIKPSRLLELRATDLDRIYRLDVKAYALLVMNIARQLSRKLRIAESILADTVTSVIDHYGDTR
jgi:CRP-like cAMP-binding protein